MIVEPKVFGDARGFFFESFNQQAFSEATGLHQAFVQDNHSRSAKGVLRGLHYQVQQPQGKPVRVVRCSLCRKSGGTLSPARARLRADRVAVFPFFHNLAKSACHQRGHHA